MNSPTRRWRFSDVAGPVMVTTTFVGLFLWTRDRLVEPIIDFGRELYTPWQLTQGRHLYVDITSYYGPLSVWFNAVLFRCFGASVQTLVTANLVILAIATALLYEIGRLLGSRLAATVICILFLTVFGFSHLQPVGVFNFVAPYSHEATHAFTLSLLALYALIRFGRTRSALWAWVIGLSVGLVFLTKPEFFVAIILAIIVGLAGLFFFDRRPQRLAHFLAAFIVPIGAAAIVMALQLSPAYAWRGLSTPWLAALNPVLRSNYFYRVNMGFDQPLAWLATDAMRALWVLMFFAPAIIVAALLRKGGPRRQVVGAAVGFSLAALLGRFLMSSDELLSIGNSLLFLVPAALLAQLCAFASWRRFKTIDKTTAVLRVSVVVFACTLMLKLGLQPRLHHYGFVLAAPALLFLVLAAIEWLPQWFERRGRMGWPLRGAVLCVTASLIGAAVMQSDYCLSGERAVVGSGTNRFYADARGPVAADAINYLQHNAPQHATLAVMPEGMLLNFLSNMPSSVRYTTYIPSDMDVYGEQTIIDDLQRNPPDYIALVDRHTPEFGRDRFGIDYAQTLRQWTDLHYSPVHLLGPAPFSSDAFSILIMKRKE